MAAPLDDVCIGVRCTTSTNFVTLRLVLNQVVVFATAGRDKDRSIPRGGTARHRAIRSVCTQLHFYELFHPPLGSRASRPDAQKYTAASPWAAMLTRGREAQARSLPDTVLSPLPRCFVRAVFLLLPVDTRLRCCEVSRAWRALLADTTFWARISLCTSSGIQRFSLPLLRAAVAKAGGRLRALDITGQATEDFCFINQQERGEVRLYRPLLEVVAANAATLTELHLDNGQFWFTDN